MGMIKHDYDSENAKRGYKLVPPDGGWGWLVLCGSTLVNLLLPGTLKSFGVLFAVFLEEFGGTAIAASWIPALCYFLYNSLGPLASYLSMKTSYRTVTLIGGLIASAGLILTSFATSITHLYFTFGVLVGIGTGLSYPPGIFIVTSYFQKYRGLANGVASSGSTIGGIILPPFLEFLLQTYDIEGATLIMGALCMNVWVGALLYHPVEQHLKRVEITDEEENALTDNYNNEENSNEAELDKKATTTVLINSTSSNKEISLISRSNASMTSLRFVSDTIHGSTLAVHPEYASCGTLNSSGKHCYLFPCCGNKKGKSSKDSIVGGLLRNPLFLLILISNATNAVGYVNFLTFLPSYGITLKFTKQMSSYLLSVVAVFDLIGRISGSAISDWLPVKAVSFYIVGILISGITLTMTPFVKTYSGLCVLCSVFGLSSGVYIGITAVTMAELLGEDKLSSSYVISLFVNGILQLIGPPVCGLIYEYTNSYNVLFTGFGVILMSGASIWVLLPFITYHD